MCTLENTSPGHLLVLAELEKNPRILAEIYFMELNTNGLRFVFIPGFVLCLWDLAVARILTS